MNETKEVVQNFIQVFKRRIGVLVFTVLLFVLVSIGALYLIEPIYKSSTAIMLQKEESIDPMAFYEMPINNREVTEDKLKLVSDIIYARSTVRSLIDSLDLDQGIQSDLQQEALVEMVRDDIKVRLEPAGAINITYFNTSAVKARDGVALLANYVVQARSRSDDNRNVETVAFFQKKLDELQNTIESQRNKIVSSTKEQLKELPVDQDILQTRLQDIDSQLLQLDWQVMKEEEKLSALQRYLNQDADDISMRPLHKLSLEEITLGQRLAELLEQYDLMRQRYTDEYPELLTLQGQITEIVRRILPAIESNLNNLKRQQQTLVDKRFTIIEDIEKAFVAKQRTTTQESNFSIYQDLYNEMKVKLEQIRMSTEIEDKKTEQVLVLNPPYIAQTPSFPDKKLVLSVGFALGLIFGGIFMGLAEALDTTIRREEDLELQKPIIAYLKDGRV